MKGYYSFQKLMVSESYPARSVNSHSVLLVGERLDYHTCFIPFLRPGATLVLNRDLVSIAEGGQDLGVLIEELLLPRIPLG